MMVKVFVDSGGIVMVRCMISFLFGWSVADSPHIELIVESAQQMIAHMFHVDTHICVLIVLNCF